MMIMTRTVMNGNNIGLDQLNNSEDFIMPLSAFRMVEKELEVLIIRIFQNVIAPKMGDMIRKVVREEIKLAQANRNVNKEASTSQSRSLELQFLDNVSSSVLTGKEIKGEGGAPVKIALVDVSTGQVVYNGPEASMKVEIVVFEADDKDNGRINKNSTRELEKKRPILSGNILHLKQGVGQLENLKFKHEKYWMRNCECVLVARVVDDFGIRVQDAKTKPFTVMDSRSRLYEKHYPPLLSDYVWRLENISRKGALHKRLSEAEINTVKDFLVSLFLDPEKLRKILDTNDSTWKALIAHAQTCSIDENVHLYSCSEGETCVAFDSVGRLRGALCNYQYIPAAELSAAKKAEMLKSVASAFKNWEDVKSFDNEASLVQCLSRISNGTFLQPIPTLNNPSGFNLEICENSQVNDLARPGYTSSQYSIPNMNCFGRTTSFSYSGLHSAFNGFNDQALDVSDQCYDLPTSDPGMVVEDCGLYDPVCLQSFDNTFHTRSEDPEVQFRAYQHQESSWNNFQLGDEGPFGFQLPNPPTPRPATPPPRPATPPPTATQRVVFR